MGDQQITQDEKYLASAVHYLLSKGQSDVARLLLTCELISSYEPIMDEEEFGDLLKIKLRGSPDFYDKYTSDTYIEQGINDDYYSQGTEREGTFRTTVRSALEAVFGESYIDLSVAVGLIEIDLDWRTRLLAENETQEQTSNQNPYIKQPAVWNGMKFDPNSPGEVAIAKALDRLGVIYLPNCLVRTGEPGSRQTLFPDFLICHEGKWGILEVDGQMYHKGSATQDYERMRKLISYIKHFDRYPAKRCMDEPDTVVKEFIGILAKK